MVHVWKLCHNSAEAMDRYKTISILVLALSLIALPGCRRLTIPHHEPSDGPVRDLITESEMEALPTVTVDIADSEEDTARFEDAEVEQKQSLYDQLASKIDREMLEKYEGSYTKEDLTTGEGDGSLAFSLSSAWILNSSNLPSAGLRVRLNPQTKEYEVVGGEFSLPKSGMGVSHERDEQSGENKTYFNFKRSF